MVENFLTEALIEKIEEAVKDFRLPVEKGEARPPLVINGYLPPKRSGVDDDYPFVIVRAENGTIESDRTEITVAIIVGCYTKDYDGHKYCLNVMSRIRNALTTMKDGIIANRYVLQLPITWNNLPEQPYPQWQLDMTTKWIYRTPETEFES